MARQVLLATPPELAAATVPLENQLKIRGRSTTTVYVCGAPGELAATVNVVARAGTASLTVVGYSAATGFAALLVAELGSAVDALFLISPVHAHATAQQISRDVRRGTDWEWGVPAALPIRVTRSSARALAATALCYLQGPTLVPELDVPVVVVRGRKDRASHRACAHPEGHYPGCCGYEIARAKHALVAADPELVASIIGEHSLID